MPDRNERAITVRGAGGTTRQIEVRSFEGRADADQGIVSGYLSTFWHVDSYATVMHPSAFTKTLQERGDKLPLLYQHNPDWAIGKLANLVVDETGLHHESPVVDDGAEGTVTLKRLRGGVPFAHSFGFQRIRERPATDADPLILGQDVPEWVMRNLPQSVYVIEEVKLWEGSIVTFPANEHAVIEALRTGIRAQGLTQTLEDLRAGRLDAASRALVAELVAAWQSAAPDRGNPAPRTEEEARSDRAFIASFLAREMGIPLENTQCAA